MDKRFNWQENPPVISIGIHLEDDGWRFWCPVCKEDFGPYEERGPAARARGAHLVAVHESGNFNAGRSPAQAQRHAVVTRAYKAARRAEKGES